ncbi:MAG: type II toxin-antitoxin system VapB family antitoxin [Rhodospirillales bacterium]
MALNIKDDHALARRLARLTGESMTDAVRIALEERIEREENRRRKASAAELLEFGRRCAARLKGRRPIDHDTLLYDDKGLARRSSIPRRSSRF